MHRRPLERHGFHRSPEDVGQKSSARITARPVAAQPIERSPDRYRRTSGVVGSGAAVISWVGVAVGQLHGVLKPADDPADVVERTTQQGSARVDPVALQPRRDLLGDVGNQHTDRSAGGRSHCSGRLVDGTGAQVAGEAVGDRGEPARALENPPAPCHAVVDVGERSVRVAHLRQPVGSDAGGREQLRVPASGAAVEQARPRRCGGAGRRRPEQPQVGVLTQGQPALRSGEPVEVGLPYPPSRQRRGRAAGRRTRSRRRSPAQGGAGPRRQPRRSPEAAQRPQDRLTMLPSRSMSTRWAAGVAPSPGMVRMSPQIG